MITVLYILLGILLLYVIICAAIALYFSNMVTHPAIKTYEHQVGEGERLGRFTKEYLASLDQESFTIPSSYGYPLHGIIQNNDISRLPENSRKIAVLCHGYSSLKITMSGYARHLMDMGFTCVMYDHRNHGESAGCAPTTMGYYEKYDLKTVIDYCYERFGSDIRILTYGESMGAAVVLSLFEIDDRPAICIADCPYSDLRQLFVRMLTVNFHIPFYRTIMLLAGPMMKAMGKFSIDDVKPSRGVLKAKAPILFCHGQADTFIPCSMSEDMVRLGPGSREIYLCPGAEHALSEVTCPEEYYSHVSSFIDRFY